MRAFAEAMGAETLSDQPKPPELSWAEFTVAFLDKALSLERSILFDLTYVQDLNGVLQETGQFAGTITAMELRHIRRNWDIFQAGVQFYVNGVEQEVPWVKLLF